MNHEHDIITVIACPVVHDISNCNCLVCFEAIVYYSVLVIFTSYLAIDTMYSIMYCSCLDLSSVCRMMSFLHVVSMAIASLC